MSTLKELWDANGGKPVKVRNSKWALGDGRLFTLLGFNEQGNGVGYHSNGIADQYRDTDSWTLYQEPRPKKKLYAYLQLKVGHISERPLLFYEHNMEVFGHARVPQFDCEVEDVG